MSDEQDPNAFLFGPEEEKDPEEEHIEFTFGRNPNRTSAMSELFWQAMLEAVYEDPDIPDEARPEMVFKMTANSVLDIVMEALDPETREEVAESLDGYLGVCLVNKTKEVDLLGERAKALAGIEPLEGESEEDYMRRVSDFEERWWDMPQPRLDMRTPDDAIREQARRYGLDRWASGTRHRPPGSSSSWGSTPSSMGGRRSPWPPTSG